MPSMTLEEISEVLFDAYRKLETVEYQLKGIDVQGHYPPIEKGKVKGNDENVAVIGNKRVEMSQINWCQIVLENTKMVTVYSKNNCGKCSFVKNNLKQLGVEYREINVDENEEDVQG